MLDFDLHHMVDSIPKIRVGNSILTQEECINFKSLMHHSEYNQNIVRMARGEGRKNILFEIVQRDDIIFGWGMKSCHAFLPESPTRNLLKPDNYDRETLHQLLEIYQKDIKSRNNIFNGTGEKKNDELIDKLSYIVSCGDYEELRYVKDWMCLVLHTAGNKDFKNYSALISTSCGKQRYMTASYFGNSRPHLKKAFVIFDYWEPCYEEGNTFIKTETLIANMKTLGLPWYDDVHSECMVRFALYPQRLIGYYYIENSEIIYYKLNPHYWDAYSNCKGFTIGDYVDINQDDVKFPAKNPYRLIYTFNGKKFNVISK